MEETERRHERKDRGTGGGVTGDGEEPGGQRVKTVEFHSRLCGAEMVLVSSKTFV